MPNKTSSLIGWCVIIIAVFLMADAFLIRPSFVKSFFIGRNTTKAKITITKATIKSLATAVHMFKLDTGRYPSQDKGLIELVQEPDDVTGWCPGGYLEITAVPPDIWKHPFVYTLTPEGEKPFVILSYGADGKPGGTGENADLSSTELE